ncbi:hypothetical protein IFVP136_C1220361 [Vibrio parahaemolyticus]
MNITSDLVKLTSHLEGLQYAISFIIQSTKFKWIGYGRNSWCKWTFDSS